MTQAPERMGKTGADRQPLSAASRAPASAFTPRRPSRVALALAALAGGLLISLLLATLQGTVAISPVTIIEIIVRHLGLPLPIHWSGSDDLIIMQVRLPRALGAALVGASLGVSGALLQGLLRNPLADPLLLGTSSGAGLGAVVAIILTASITLDWLGFSLVALLAFVGALLSVGLVYALATRGGRTPVVTLLLAGVAVGAMLTAAQTLLISLFVALQERFGALYFWFWRGGCGIMGFAVGSRRAAGGRPARCALDGAHAGRFRPGRGDGVQPGCRGGAPQVGDRWRRGAPGSGVGDHWRTDWLCGAGGAARLPDCAGAAQPSADSGVGAGRGDIRRPG